MKQLTRKDLSNLVQDSDAWRIDVHVASINLSVSNTVLEFDDISKHIYKYRIEGRVKISSARYKIRICFDFEAEGAGFDYASAFKVGIWNADDTCAIEGFTLIDNVDNELTGDDFNKAIDLALTWCNWRVEVKKQIPVLPQDL